MGSRAASTSRCALQTPLSPISVISPVTVASPPLCSLEPRTRTTAHPVKTIMNLFLALLLAGAPQQQSGGVDVGVSFEDDVGEEALAAWKARVEAASAILFRLTEGQVWIATSTIEDKSARGRVVVVAGHVEKDLLPEGDAMARTLEMATPAWHILAAGRPDGHAGRT